MHEYRMCENQKCGHKNHPSYMECEKCGWSLEGINVTTGENIKLPPLPPPELSEPLVPLESGESEIGERASVRGTQTLRKIKLVARKDGFEIPIPVLGCLIGREGDVSPEYFSTSTYVSRQHARIDLKEDSYVIVDDSHNGTTVNNRPLIRHREYKVEVGDKIVFADMEFVVGEWQ